jgi:hypothetical protein
MIFSVAAVYDRRKLLQSTNLLGACDLLKKGRFWRIHWSW